ncbi:MAG: aminotransferase class IV [Spirochaetes bacterium]|nr:aminotransferase class IV [Spirochaetota bacterium]
MIGPYCIFNQRLIPIEQAVVSVDDLNFSYGYGVYETLKVRNRILYFPSLHEERLFHSASVIGLSHPFKPGDITGGIQELVRANKTEHTNIKVLLIGGDTAEQARLYIMTLNPLFPDRKDYKQGATALIYPGERVFPEAKTLNMLVSTLAFRAAKKAGAYDAVLKNRDGYLTEGTRTNLFYVKGEVVYTPPRKQVLEGVTRITLLDALQKKGIPVQERPILATEIPDQDGFFLTSTSTKVMPLKKLGEHNLTIPSLLREIMKHYDAYLEAYAASQEALF